LTASRLYDDDDENPVDGRVLIEAFDFSDDTAGPNIRRDDRLGLRSSSSGNRSE